ncbi:hypothetical protein OGR47_12055 [Methylocystis sp. MJC1]|jgi:ABC-type nitrate/sulfonate/bicarbonate transport system permease component|uniref:hypothetical protein n=1 Tax=Methylocystis sp. MJC1 TaxID=2654282 RepID=UPI0013EAEAEA|nr:hypothetical protein [Methylocystis sp. MJC1]KAF2990817.1 hypothetical protein MJC1_01914 [Methylocystis sp. MJC1]MBU6527712.1 hypothetical protein [Methylocystis sp. MJC1]UZX10648.1 hypothetical protein OGR47_12055 [Methylocystis sp. MJC1]
MATFFAFLFGFALALIIGFLLGFAAAAQSVKDEAARGVMSIGGNHYRCTKIDAE